MDRPDKPGDDDGEWLFATTSASDYVKSAAIP
jgi:hypothetical protein